MGSGFKREWRDSCLANHSDWKHMFWDKAGALAFLGTHYPWFIPTFLNYPKVVLQGAPWVQFSAVWASQPDGGFLRVAGLVSAQVFHLGPRQHVRVCLAVHGETTYVQKCLLPEAHCGRKGASPQRCDANCAATLLSEEAGKIYL